MSANKKSMFSARKPQWHKPRTRIEEVIPLNHARITSRAKRRL